MSNQRYPDEFKIEAVKQVTERDLPGRGLHEDTHLDLVS